MVLKIVGFIIGFAAVAVLEAAILSAFHSRPLGLGWVVFPIIAGIGLARETPGLVARFSRSGGALWRTSPGVRLVGVSSAMWLVAVPLYWWLFEPYDGSHMYSDDYAFMFKVMFFPVVVLVGGYIAYVKLVAGSPPPSGES